MKKAAIYFLIYLFNVGCNTELPQPDEKVESFGEPWIVFSSGRSGNGDIYAINSKTRETILVAGTDSPEGTVRYDAYQKRIVYHRYDQEPERAVLVSSGEDLFEDPNGDVAPAWSSEAGRVVYAADREGFEDLYIAMADGQNQLLVTQDEWIDRYPSWSPDGQAVVYAKKLEDGWDLHVMRPFDDDKPEERLTNDGVYVGHPSWSPDGRYIAYDTLIDGQAEIAMLEIATGEVTRLTNRAGNDLIPAWSPDGKKIAFGGEPDSAGNWDLWMVDLETLQITRLTEQPTYDGGPVFVPASVIGR